MRKTEFTLQVPVLTVGVSMPIPCTSHTPVSLPGAVSSDMISPSTEVTFFDYTGYRGRSGGQWSSFQGSRGRTRSVLLVATNKAG